MKRQRACGVHPALVLIVACLTATPGFSATVYVDLANDTGVEDGTLANPYNTIQEGIDNALQGDRVIVASGQYKETVAMKDGVSVLGSGAATTIIDGTGLENSVVIFNGTRLSPVLSDFTISGGSGDASRDVGGVPVNIGGGILVNNSSPLITRNVITDNTVEEGYCLGAGIYVYSALSTPQIIDNVISGNVALSATQPDSGEGGGVYVVSKNGGVVIEGNRIESNRALQGGGIFVQNNVDSTAEIRRNILQGNDARDGAALFLTDLDGSGTTVRNNLIRGNGSDDPAARGGGIFASSVGTGAFSILNNTFVENSVASGTGGAVWLDDLASTGANVVANSVIAGNTASLGGGIDHTRFFGEIRNTDFYDNPGGDLYDGGGSGASLVGNLFVDPRFVGPSPGNFRLGGSSPCIDAADDSLAPSEDLDRFYRPYDGDGDATATSDIGAYEYPGGEVLGVAFLGDGESLNWDLVPLQDGYNVYRGALARLRDSGEYTQDPLVEPLAQRFCDIPPGGVPFLDPFVPPSQNAVFYLVTVVIGDWEGSAGADSTGLPRPNGHPCP